MAETQLIKGYNILFGAGSEGLSWTEWQREFEEEGGTRSTLRRVRNTLQERNLVKKGDGNRGRYYALKPEQAGER